MFWISPMGLPLRSRLWPMPAPFLGLLLLCFKWTSADVVIIRPDNQTEKVFIDYELTFTAAIPTDGIQGMVQVANPPDACNPIDKPPFVSNTSLRWFVLIERYPCSFEIKVRNAQAAGYHAAIVYNVGLNTPPQGNVATASSVLDADIEIPGILIGQDDGKKMKTEYTYRTGYTVIINPDSAFNLNTYLLPFAIVIGFCFIIMLLFMIIKCIKDRRRSRRNRLSSRHLKHLPTIKFKQGDKYEVCAVCLEDYCEGEKLRILPCSHAYHTKCIDPWLTNNRRNCPICKRKVAIPGVTPDSDSDSETDQEVSEHTPLLQSTSTASSTSQTFPVTRTNGGTFGGSSSSSNSSTGSRGSRNARRNSGISVKDSAGSQYRLLDEDNLPGPSSSNGSFQEDTSAQMHLPPKFPGIQSARRQRRGSNSSSEGEEEDIYHSSTQLLAPDNRHSINGEEDDASNDDGGSTPPVMVVVTAETSKPPKKTRTELVV